MRLVVLVAFVVCFQQAYSWQLACNSETRPNTQTDLNGRFTSPYYPGSYPNNALCDWHLQGPSGSAVRLDFGYFYTESCCDHVQIFDGPDSGSPFLASYSGTSLPPSTYSNVSSMFVRFTTDGSVQAPGFDAVYNADPACRLGSTEIRSESGSISTPYHPYYYPHTEDCAWDIIAGSGGHVHIQFSNFSTQYCTYQCYCDYVELYDGGSLMGRWCGGNSPGYVVSTTNRLTVKFVSDSSSGYYSGFYANYYLTSTAPETKPMLPPSIDIPLNGTGNKVGLEELTPQCLLAYENEFTYSTQTAVTLANLELEAGNLCGESVGIHSLWEDSELRFDEGDNTKFHLELHVAVPGQGEYTLNDMEVCATAVMNFLINLNNWYQPVLPNLDNCPELQISPFSLNDNGMQWCRPDDETGKETYDIHGHVIPPCKKKAAEKRMKAEQEKSEENKVIKVLTKEQKKDVEINHPKNIHKN